MRILRIEVNNFRGINELAWDRLGHRAALIGPGDSGKSTLLDAIELVFWPRYSLRLTDNDIWQADTEKTVIIRAWVLDPPEELTRDGSFFTHLMGFDSQKNEITMEPESGSIVLGIQLSFSGDLEPYWEIFNQHAEPKRIRAIDRSKFGVSRIGGELATHLKLGRGSSLLKMSNDANDSLNHALRSAARTARSAASTSGAFNELAALTSEVTAKAKELRAVDGESKVNIALDADILNVSQGAISLHEGNLPIGRRGLGSQRLTSIAVQLTELSAARIILVDEIETGLEPHRIRHLIRALNEQKTNGYLDQLFFSTHSPTPIREVKASELNVFRKSSEAVVTVEPVPEELQGAVRAHAEAFLAPRILVCEGATEVGFARSIMDWSERLENGSHAPVAATADAGGTQKIVGYANDFAHLKYDTAVFCDNDDPSLKISDLSRNSSLFQTERGLSIETQVAKDLSIQGLKEFAEFGLETIERGALNDKLRSKGCHEGDLDSLLSDGPEDDGDPSVQRLRFALGTIAQKDGRDWFKYIDGGAYLGEIALTEVKEGTWLCSMIEDISRWCRGT